MSNHVHLVVTPRHAKLLALALKYTHGRYAAYFNTRHVSSGHVWQGRYYSCPLDLAHLWAALRYTELNPVRAGMAQTAAEYPWSSARLHCGEADHDGLLDLETWRQSWTPTAWHDFLCESQAAKVDDEIRRCTHTGRPLGAPAFVRQLETALHRRLTPSKGGRPAKQGPDDQETTLSFSSGLLPVCLNV
jgi:putative transposase